jgi:RNA polymerase-binding transcription factor DksA
MLSDVVDDLDYALVTLQAETLEHIEDALDRLDAGEYGFCLDCGKEIPARRLEALPFAVRCRPCEDANEERHQLRPVVAASHRPAFLG